MKAWVRIAAIGLILAGACLPRAATPRPSLTSVIVLMEGVEGDRGPFDFAAAGVAAFQRSEGVRVPLIALGYDPLAWERMIREAVRDPNHRLFLIGMEGPARLGLEMARIFPGKRFILLGLPPEEAISPNVLAISFDEWEMGWVAGYLAGRWMDPARTRQLIGALVGPGAEALWEGYACGAQAAGTPLEALRVETVASDQDPSAGFEAALRLYAQGVHIAAGLAGGSSAGLFEAAGALRRYAIGVGADWYDRYAAMRSPAMEVLFGSVTPAVDEVVRRTLRQSRRGELSFGIHQTLGWRAGGITWRGSPLFFHQAPWELQQALRERALQPTPCSAP
ncbi:MAG: BMP family ABC transporter substrate-binding protein [Thermoflexus sp.]|jgi:basic membrane protein A|nr:BMP family ABC transporter substrate-binding protein [Thermoflexus sp.]